MKNLPRWALAAALGLLWACTSGPAGVTASEVAAPLSGKTLAGKTIALADFKDKVVLVDFWATWCGPCRAEIPGLVKLQERLGPKGFTILGVSMDDEVSEVAPFVKAMNINYPVIINGGERAPKGWIQPGLPTAYLIGRDGKILMRTLGAKSIDKLAIDVEAALAKK